MLRREQEQVTVISTGYYPRPLQAELHRKLTRFSVLALHRRFGKTVLAINELIDRAINCPLQNPQVCYIAPYLIQAKRIAWKVLKQYTWQIPGVRQYESELKVVIPLGEGGNEATIQLFGADHPDSLRGIYLDHCVFDEYGLQPVSIWTEVVRPALSDRHGGATFLGTPAGKNQFHEIYQFALQRMALLDPEWFAAMYRADQTGVIDDKELQSLRDSMPVNKFRQEMLCDWTAGIEGAFYASEMERVREEGRIMSVPHEARLPVFVAFDLGYHDHTALWFVQFHHHEIRLINYLEFENTGLLEVLREIQQLPYVYAELFMPWDVGVHDLFTGRSRIECIQEMGFRVTVSPKKVTKEDGIHAVRTILPKCFFDEKKTSRGIDCLENFRKKIDPHTGVFMSIEQKDEFVHGSDSFRYLAVCYEEEFGKSRISGEHTYLSAMGRGKVIRSV